MASICFHYGFMPEIKGPELRRHRVERGLAKSQLATECEISARYVAELEKGRYAPRIEVIYRLARALDVPAASLMQDPGSDPLTAGTAA